MFELNNDYIMLHTGPHALIHLPCPDRERCLLHALQKWANTPCKSVVFPGRQPLDLHPEQPLASRAAPKRPLKIDRIRNHLWKPTLYRPHIHHSSIRPFTMPYHHRSQSPSNATGHKVHPRSRSPTSHRHHHRHHHATSHRQTGSKSKTPAILPFHASSISGRHYEDYKPMFELYLDIQKQKILEELPEDEVKGRWKSFVGKWYDRFPSSNR